ncbi:MAG: hypothetical protein HQK52_19435 [Oligoflexia bacterium]|nr:hypothetical protein [Oligoflexia bacterium]
MAQTAAMYDKLLTTVSTGYFPTGFIATKIFPSLPVKQSTGALAGYGSDHIRIENTLMGGRGKAPRYESMTRKISYYSVERHGIEGLVTQDDYDNYDLPYDAEKDETIGITTVLTIGKEKAMADQLMNKDVVKSNVTLSGENQLSNYEKSDPLAVVRQAQNTIYDKCGLAPNKVIMNWKVYNALSYHPKILGNLGYSQARAGTLTTEELAKAMKIETLLIGNTSYNAAAYGKNAENMTSIWSDDILFYYAPDIAGKYQMSFGYYIIKSGETPLQVYTENEFNPPGAKKILVTDNYGISLTNINAAFLVKAAI